MLKFIGLTSAFSDEKIYINPNQICSFHRVSDGTFVYFAETKNKYLVEETPEEIINMIDSISTEE